MAETRLFCEQATLTDTFASFGDCFGDLLFQVREVLLDAHKTVHHSCGAVADLHQAVLLWWDGAGPVASLVLICEQHRQIGFDFRRVFLGVCEDDLCDDADCTVDCADVGLTMPLPWPRRIQDRVDNIVLSICDQLESFGIVDERRFDEPKQVQVSTSSVEELIVRLRVQNFRRVVAQISDHVYILTRRGADRQQRQDIVRDAAFSWLRPRVISYGVLRLLEVCCRPGPEQLSFDLEVVVHLLENEEGVRHADGAFEEAAGRLDARGWVFIDEAGQGGFELLVWIWELRFSKTVSDGMLWTFASPLLASGASFLK
jgi:hypothetical protein